MKHYVITIPQLETRAIAHILTQNYGDSVPFFVDRLECGHTVIARKLGVSDDVAKMLLLSKLSGGKASDPSYKRFDELTPSLTKFLADVRLTANVPHGTDDIERKRIECQAVNHAVWSTCASFMYGVAAYLDNIGRSKGWRVHAVSTVPDRKYPDEVHVFVPAIDDEIFRTHGLVTEAIVSQWRMTPAYAVIGEADKSETLPLAQ